MNIAIVGQDLITKYGGAENHAINVIRELNKYYNILYFPDPAKYKKIRKQREDMMKRVKELEDKGVKITKVFYTAVVGNYNPKQIMKIYLQEKIDLILSFDVINYSSLRFIFDFSKKGHIKFGIVLQGLFDFDIHALPYLKSTIELVKISHSTRIVLYRIYHFFIRNIFMHSLNNAKNLLFTCIVNQNYYENAKLNVKNIEILRVQNGIKNYSDNKFKIIQNKNYQMIYFARLSYNKGIFDIPLIMKEIIKSSDIKLVIVGKFTRDNEKVEFFHLLDVYGLKDKIIYKGYLNNQQLFDEIAKSKIMIYPSHSDSFSLAIAQALANHTPVVTYNIAGLKIYKKFSAVKMVNEFDYKALADEAVKILKMENTDHLFDNGIDEFINQHSWDNVAREYKNILDKYIETDGN